MTAISPSEYKEFYDKAVAYCTQLTAGLPDGATATIVAAHPELAGGYPDPIEFPNAVTGQYLRRADVAVARGDRKAYQGALREWMRGWRAAVQAHHLAAAA